MIVWIFLNVWVSDSENLLDVYETMQQCVHLIKIANYKMLTYVFAVCIKVENTTQ